MQKLPVSSARRYAKDIPYCRAVGDLVDSISDFFELIDGLLPGNDTYWYRGHADTSWTLTPGALRPADGAARSRALSLWQEFRRTASLRLSRDERPPVGDDLQWLGVAQHYGLPTRLLDWTENPAVALYFATLRADRPGAVFVMKPTELNASSSPKDTRILDAHTDGDRLAKYLKLGERASRGKSRLRTVAVKPTYNTQRILLQRGAFTLHGSNHFALDNTQAPSLVCIPILQAAKVRLAEELARIGFDEMSIYPEPEHVCSQLRRACGL